MTDSTTPTPQIPEDFGLQQIRLEQQRERQQLAERENARKEQREGCMGGLLGIAVLAVALIIAATNSSACGCQAPINSAIQASSQTGSGGAQDSALPIVQPSASTPTNSPTESAPTTTLPNETTTTQQSPTQQSPTQQTPTQQQAAPPPSTAPPTPTTAAGCHWAYPSSIGVEGGSPSELSGQGGSFQVVGSPVVMHASMTPCGGHHYKLAWSSSGSSGTANGSDCESSAFNDNISGYVHDGDSVSVQIFLPVNDCG